MSVPPSNPSLQGHFAPVADEIDRGKLKVRGNLPKGLNGLYLRTGPNPKLPPREDYYFFEGDGMLHGIWLRDGQATGYRNRYVRTAGLARDEAAGRDTHRGPSSRNLLRYSLVSMVRRPDVLKRLLLGFRDPVLAHEALLELSGMKNAANTSLVRHAGRILAMWEAGSPYEVDHELRTLGLARFKDAPPIAAFSAHPKVERRTGWLHTFGLHVVPKPAFHYYAYDETGRIAAQARVPLRFASLMHDFVVTERHVVVLNFPVALTMLDWRERSGETYRWQPHKGTEVVVLDRRRIEQGLNDRAEVARIAVPPSFAQHFGAAWSTPDSVFVDVCEYSEPPLGLGRGTEDAPDLYETSELTRWRIDLQRKCVHREVLDERWPVEFPFVNEHYRFSQNRYTYFGAPSRREQDGSFVNDTVCCFDGGTGTTSHFTFPDREVLEGTFAIDPDGSGEENAGWVLFTTWKPQTEDCRLVVFDAADITSGPLCEVQLPQRLAMAFHASWLPNTGCSLGCPVCAAPDEGPGREAPSPARRRAPQPVR